MSSHCSISLGISSPACGLGLLALAVVFPGGMSACEISMRDQVLLIQMSESGPRIQMSETGPRVEPPSVTIRGAEVQCATIGPLRIVQPLGARYYYILDPRRAFHRWGRTGTTFAGDPIHGLRGSLELYRLSSDRLLWAYYGRPSFDEDEMTNLNNTLEVVW